MHMFQPPDCTFGNKFLCTLPLRVVHDHIGLGGQGAGGVPPRDELIELTLPADDTYTMVVHGWSVPNAPLPYTLHFWSVPLAAGGGSLNIDSAPASATLGTTGTVNVSWSGLAGGTSYLGAVSHTGDAGLIGLTLVEVDSP